MQTARPGAPAALRAVNRALAGIILLLLIVSVGVLVIPVSLQIFSRYTSFIPSYIWTEEMARFCLVYAVMLGAMLAVREGTHFTSTSSPACRRGTRRWSSCCRAASSCCSPSSSCGGAGSSPNSPSTGSRSWPSCRSG